MNRPAPTSTNPIDRPVVVLTTGGTIDKLYSITGELFTGPPAVKHLMEAARVSGKFEIIEVLAKDSLEMTEDDRHTIAEQVKAVSGAGIVITHGTDTMTVTAEFLSAQIATWDLDPDSSPTVVLTGAMHPAAMRSTDSPFNLGAAITAAQLLPPGVYIAMNGHVFRAGQTRKDKDLGLFVPIDTE